MLLTTVTSCSYEGHERRLYDISKGTLLEMNMRRLSPSIASWRAVDLSRHRMLVVRELADASMDIDEAHCRFPTVLRTWLG